MSTIVPDPGDAVAQCFDALAGFGDWTLDKLSGQTQGKLAALYEAVADSLRSFGVVPAGIPMQSGPAFASLKALNDVLGDLDPARSAAIPPNLAYLRARLGDTGQLDTGLYGGAVVVRHAFPGRVGAHADGLGGRLDCLIRVPEESWSRVTLRYPMIDPLTVSSRINGMTVAAVAYYGSREEVRFVEHPGVEQPFYSAGPAPDLDRAARVRAALAGLDGSGAIVALVPELTLDQTTVDKWIAAVTATDGSGTALRWILIGTGAVEAQATGSRLVHDVARSDMVMPTEGAVNRAVLLDRLTGQVVLTQDKQHGFHIAKSNIANWSLSDQLSPEKHAEWLDTGKQLNLLGTAHGRLAILICEDLNRAYTIGKLAWDLAAAIVLSPVFGAILMPADPKDQKQWAQLAAEELATGIGSRVAVANSMAITRTYWHTTEPTVTLFTVRPLPPPVETHGVIVSRGATAPGIDSAILPPDDDATMPRMAML